MYLPIKNGKPRKTNRKRCARNNAKHAAKNRRRKSRLTRP